jgi:N-acetylglucosaminyldiphosphoundecaprenol N-acetyl-beta-D-mannosaminyltransferase
MQMSRGYHLKIIGVSLSNCTFSDIIQEMQRRIKCREKGYISITNTESIYHATRLSNHRFYINHADFSCCDGVGVVLIGKMQGLDIPRLHGPDLMTVACREGVENGWRHYFYGGREGVPEKVSRHMTDNFPGLVTAGTLSPPFRELSQKEELEIVERINDARPDILWVALGLLKQEAWIAKHFDVIEAPWMIGVGAAFDFHAGTIKRAPLFYQKIGMEWLYRLAFEPRMFIRNVYSFKLLFKALFKRNRRS